MKSVQLFGTLALLATVSALPAEVHDRSLPLAIPRSPKLPAFTGLPDLSWGSWFPAPARPSSSTTSIPPTTPVTTATTATTTTTTTTTYTTTLQAPSTTVSAKPSQNSGSGNNDDAGTSTENGVLDGECKELTVIYARGTSETGNVGTVAGPPMFSALRSALGDDKVTVQGVDYPATSQGNEDMGADGGPTMASLVQQALSQCPSTKIALSGYSQGAMVVHNTIGRSGAPGSSIAAVVLFGDPMSEEGVDGVAASQVLEFCADGDGVCDGSGNYAITQAHLTYGSDAQQAADFIIDTAGLS